MKNYSTVAVETDIKGVDSNDELSALFTRALEVSKAAKIKENICKSSYATTRMENLSCENVTYCIQHAESVDLKPIPLPSTNVQEYIQKIQKNSIHIESNDEDIFEEASYASSDTGKTNDDYPDYQLQDTSHQNRHSVTAWTAEKERNPVTKCRAVADESESTVGYTKVKLHCTHCSKTYTSQGPYKKHLAKHEMDIFLKEDIRHENQETVQETKIIKQNNGGHSSFGNTAAELQSDVTQPGAQQAANEQFQTCAKEKSYKCTFCDKSFTKRYEFVRHLQVHSGEKLHKCEVCEKAFTRKWYLAEHLRTHTGERPHKCDLCNVAFVNKANLNKHLQIHSGVRQHKCGFCDKAFMRKHDIIRHLRIHTGERPYKCEYCAKAFMIKQHLVEHRRRHTGERPHKCGYCDMAFVTKGCLNKHVKRHRRKDLEEGH